MECSEANIKKVKKCLMDKIRKEESILECATVKLSICSPQTNKKFLSLDKEGILCVIVDRNKTCLYLKLYDLTEFKLLFAIELYTNVEDGYTVCDNYFHSIEFPGFFLGLSFPILENPNVASRNSLIQKAIIATSKFISIKLSDYVYLYEFDKNKKYNKHKGGSEKSLPVNKGKNMKINNNNINNNDKAPNGDDENNINNKSNDKIEPEQNNNKIEDNENNNINNEVVNNNIENNNKLEEAKIKPKRPETMEEKERNIFDNIIIEDASNSKIYKIVQYHFVREKAFLVKKLYKKNFERFIDGKRISFENIKNYNINTYDFLNDVYSSSDEEEEQKTFVDYVPSKDMIGDLENEHIDVEDERLMELMQKRNNLKEIIKKNVENPSVLKTTAI